MLNTTEPSAADTQLPDHICGEAAALCTGFEGDPLKAERGAMKRGHESVMEHASFTFLIGGVSRVLLAQLTRHRLASVSVQSQRYAGIKGCSVIIPESVRARMEQAAQMHVNEALSLYGWAIEHGVPEEDARYLLPQGITTRLMMTMNGRELRHFLSLRMCNRAQWEIRALADAVYKEVKRVAPGLMDHAGPGCVRGGCPEADACCGHGRYEEIMELMKCSE